LTANGFDATPREGAKSQYDVVVDGETIFSKQELGRFPEDGEIAELLGSRS
jgi:Rdx family protein